MSYIFFSYSSKTSTDAGQIVNALRGAGFVVWQDVDNIPLGEEWEQEITTALEGAAVLLVLWSRAAKSSAWVQKEIEIAESLGKMIVPVSLDGSDFTTHDILQKKQGIKLRGRFDEGLAELQERLPQAIRRRKLDFDAHQPIRLQKRHDIDPWEIDGVQLFQDPLLESGYCKAYVVGAGDTIVGSPKRIQLCIQVSRGTDAPFIPDVFKVVRDNTREFKPEDFVAIHITGPTRGGEYRLDNDNPAHWIDAVDTTYQAVIALSRNDRPTLQVFNLGTVVLGTALGAKFFKFWHLQLFQFAGGTYKNVLTVLPES